MYSNCNAMLSLVMLVPFYSVALNLGLDWVFKIIYPFLFALVPLGLYAVFKRQTNSKIAFLACFFFMSLFVFYAEMVSLARQEIAELFLVLIILSMLDRDLTGLQRAVLFLAFSMSLIVSHYGLSYLFMFILFVAWALATVGYYVDIWRSANQLFAWMQSKVHLLSGLNLQKYSFHPILMPFNFVLFYGLFILIWYIYMSSSSSFDAIIKIVHQIATSISSELFNPDAAQGLAIITTEAATPLHEIGKYLQLLTIFFVVIGFVISFVHHSEIRFNIRYLLMAFGALCICIGGVVLPYFASALNTSRVYQICLIFLAPFCIVGGMIIFSGFRTLLGKPSRSLQLLSVFFGIFLLFNCGWIYEFGQDDTTSFALNENKDSASFNTMEFCGAEWLFHFTDGKKIYGDDLRRLLIKRYFGDAKSRITPKVIKQNWNEQNWNGIYVFFGTVNTQTAEFSTVNNGRYEYKKYDFTLCSLIYNCDGSIIYSF